MYNTVFKHYHLVESAGFQFNRLQFVAAFLFESFDLGKSFNISVFFLI